MDTDLEFMLRSGIAQGCSRFSILERCVWVCLEFQSYILKLLLRSLAARSHVCSKQTNYVPPCNLFLNFVLDKGKLVFSVHRHTFMVPFVYSLQLQDPRNRGFFMNLENYQLNWWFENHCMAFTNYFFKILDNCFVFWLWIQHTNEDYFLCK